MYVEMQVTIDYGRTLLQILLQVLWRLANFAQSWTLDLLAISDTMRIVKSQVGLERRAWRNAGGQEHAVIDESIQMFD
jgi:hypothetical protein